MEKRENLFFIGPSDKNHKKCSTLGQIQGLFTLILQSWLVWLAFLNVLTERNSMWSSLWPEKKYSSRKWCSYQPSGDWGTRSMPATQHCLQRPKWLPTGSKWPLGSGKRPILGFLVLLSTFVKYVFWLFLLWEPQKIKLATRGPQNCRWGPKRCLPLRFGALSSTFAK